MTLPDSPVASDDQGLLDTSIFIALETNRPLGMLPQVASVSVITLAELHLGVLMADDTETRSRRLRTLAYLESRFEPLSIDAEIARTFAEINAEARRQGRRLNVMNAWIAATAVTHNLTVYTQDSDFLTIPQVRAVQV